MNIATHKLPIATGSVRLINDPSYLSVEKLNNLGRIMCAKDLAIEENANELFTFIDSIPELQNKYIIIRARGTYDGEDRTSTIKRFIEKKYGPGHITEWNSTSPRPERTSPDSDGSSTKMEDINELLKEEPDSVHFVLIKGMFYAAKTMTTSYVGILYDSASKLQKHDTALQSFLGRACGYKKNTDIYKASITGPRDFKRHCGMPVTI
jgi:hypothetical protein